MKTGRKNFLRVCIFSLITLVMLFGLNSFFQPIWYEWNNYYTMNGFYEEPENTLEAVVLGPSIALTSIAPTELYTNYGISAYNLGTERQPVFASYYWLQEVYRLHGESLKTVIFDVSAVREDATTPFYHKVFDSMKLSEVKLKAVWDYTNEDIGKTINFMVPLLSYHNRWSSLNKTDFEKFNVDPDQGTRGYFYLGYIYADRKGYDNVPDKLPILDTTAEPGKLDNNSVEYLKKMAAFCKEKGLELLLIRTTTNNWSSSYHNAIQPIATELGLEFLDFNFYPLYDSYGYVHAYDTKDGNHLNYYGATKFTKWLGKHLVDNYSVTDVRGKPGYEHIEKQVEEYTARVIEHTKLVSTESVTDYLTVASKGQNTVLITVEDEAAITLSDKDREIFASLGLEKLSQIGYRDSYIGVIENGKVIYENTKSASVADGKGITYSGTLNNGSTYNILSAGNKHGKTSYIKIDGKNAVDHDRGINIVVYSNLLKEVDDATVFDTFIRTTRERYGVHNTNLLLDKEELEKEHDPNSIEGRIIAYKERIDRLEEQTILQNKIGKNNLFGFLDYYWKDSDNIIAISVYDQAADALTNVDRKNFLDRGLNQLATLAFNDSYVAFVEGGKVVKEKKSNTEQVFWNDVPGFYLKSGSTSTGRVCSITINGEQYAPKKRGINIVVFNKKLGAVIARTYFNTYAEPLTYSNAPAQQPSTTVPATSVPAVN